tara:strand:+ start:22413 stop:23030 length:618 start_codon:yes stop_codon:yes gene_type:complete
MKKTMIAAAVATAMIMGGTAIAAPKVSSTSELHWYAGLGAGYSYVQDKQSHTMDGSHYEGIPGGLAGNVFAGYNFNQYIGMEVSYDDIANTSTYVADGDGTLAGGTKYNGIGFGLVGNTPALHGMRLFVKLGGEYLHGRSFDMNATTNSVGLAYGAGMSYNITQHLIARGEWKQVLQQKNVSTNIDTTVTVPQMNLFLAQLAYSF